MKKLFAYLLILSLALTLVKSEDAPEPAEPVATEATETPSTDDHDNSQDIIDIKAKILKDHLSDPAGLITYNQLLPHCYGFFLSSDLATIEEITERQNDDTKSVDEDEGLMLAGSMYLRHYAASHFEDIETVDHFFNPKIILIGNNY